MSINKKIIVSFAIFILSFLFLILFKSIPMTQLWKGYSVLYVKSDTLSIENISLILEKNNVKNVISSNVQSLPIFSKYAPVQVQKNDSYILKRSGFFKDSSKEYNLFYVPEKYSSNLEYVIAEISSFSNSVAGTDGRISFPWICPIISLCFAVLLVYFSNKKFLSIICFLPFVVFSFCRPLYTVCAAVCFAETSLFFAQQTLGRKGFILNNYSNLIYILILLFAPIAFLIFSSGASSVLYVISLLGALSAIYLHEQLMSFSLFSNSDFDFVYIKSAAFVQTVNKKSLKYLLYLFSAILILLCVSFFTKSFSNAFTNSEVLSLPTPVNYESKNLPSTKDFFDWSWDTISFPYRRLGLNDDNPNSIYFKDYKIENEKIYTTETKILSYDSSFINSICDKVKDIEYPAIEKMLLQQGRDVQFDYSKKVGTTTEKAVTVILLLFSAIPIFLVVYYILRKLKYGFDI